MSYASGTKVSQDRSLSEIQQVLQKYGASKFGNMIDFDTGVASVAFVYQGINIKIAIPLPLRTDKEFTTCPKQLRNRSKDAGDKLYLEETNRRWRALAMCIKAKLVAVQDEIATFEAEFMPYMVTNDGTTLAEKMLPMIEKAKKGGGFKGLPEYKGGELVSG